jgi:hypothetical protein
MNSWCSNCKEKIKEGNIFFIRDSEYSFNCCEKCWKVFTELHRRFTNAVLTTKFENILILKKGKK